MFEDIIGKKEKPKELILEVNDVINYIHYTFDNGQLEVDINWATFEVEVSGNKIKSPFCFDKLKEIHEILKDKSPFEFEPNRIILKSGWVFV